MSPQTKIRWSDFLEQIKDAGYEGSDDDLASVKLWLKANGHSTDTVEVGEGSCVALDELYQARPGRPLDASAAAKRAEFNAAVEAKTRSMFEEFRASGLVAPQPDKSTHKNPPKHDVKVGRERLSDDPAGGFKSMGDFCKHVINATTEGKGVSDELALWTKATLSTYGSEGVGADGGYTVPQEFVDEIEKVVQGEASVLGRTRQFTLQRNSIRLPLDDNEPWSSSGISGAWEGEAGAIGQSKPVLKDRELRLRKYTVLVPLTDELVEDASAMTQYVTMKASEKIDFAIGEAIFRGTGAGQPFGFLNAGSLISVTKETNQAADTITSPNIFKMWSRLYGPFRANSVWWINQDIEPQLFRLSVQGRTDSGGAISNAAVPVYLPAGTVAGSPFATLLGRPVIPTQHCETLGDAGDIILADMSQYLTAVKAGGVNSASSIHLWFDQNVTALRFTMRIDGQPAFNSTISPRDGSNTMSAFVALAARA